jgi:hypothetical protein
MAGKAVNVGEKVMTLADPERVELAAWLPPPMPFICNRGRK